MIKACAENESELNRVCNNENCAYMKECLIWLLPEVGFQMFRYYGLLPWSPLVISLEAMKMKTFLSF